MTIEVGTIIEHPKRPAWGPGKVLAVGSGGNVTVYFRDLLEEKANDAVKTISTSVVGLEVADEQTDFLLDNLPIFDNGRFKGLRKPRLSFDQAVEAFIGKQPGAFANPRYLEEQRAPRLGAHRSWVDELGGGQADELLDAGNFSEVRKRLMKIEAKLDFLSPHEKAALKRGLTNEESAPFLRALLAVTESPEPEQSTFQRLIETADLVTEKEPGSRATNWPVLTQFPFIAHPEKHIEFKPTVVLKCAARLNFDLRYSATPNWWTYDRLLRLAKTIRTRLEPVGARDFIDVGWFIQVIATV